MPSSPRPADAGPVRPSVTRSPWVRGLVLVAVIALLVVGGRRLGGVLPEILSGLERLGPWGPVLFVALYVAAAVALVPGSILTLAAGVLFGLGRGVLLVFVGATLGATAAFLVARYVARDAVARRVNRDPRFAAVDRAIEREGGRMVFLLRLSPLLPFNLLNYALGVTRVRLGAYVLGSVGMLPGTVLYVYYGKLAGTVAGAATGGAAAGGAGRWVILGLGLVATVVATTLVTRAARRALREVEGDVPMAAATPAPEAART